MAVSPDDFLALARDLATREDEISRRCAATRAYYAIYHNCRELTDKLPASQNNIPEQVAGVHERLIGRLTGFVDEDKERQKK